MQKRGILIILLFILSSSVLALTGDFNKDDCVNLDDFFLFANNFQKEVNKDNEKFDLDKNNKIDVEDFFIFAEDYGKCEEEIPSGENKKNRHLYKEKQVFLISDKDWKDVLQLVSLTTWTVPDGYPDLEWCNKLKDEDGSVKVFNEKDENGKDIKNYVCGYPTLIYHEETTGFDADSIIHFMQQYRPDRVIAIGEMPQELANLLITEPELGAGLKANNIKKILTNDYLSYWNSYDKIIYVEENYELTLIASTYASLINAPLIVKDGALDKENNLKGRKIICVGNTEGKKCSESYNLEELQKKYVEFTNTNKIILVNPNDLIIKNEFKVKISEKFYPDKSKAFINELYSMASLSAPVLASGKHELIISNKIPINPSNSDCQKVQEITKNAETIDSFVDNFIGKLFSISQGFLTIIASPRAIPESTFEECDGYYQKRKLRDVEYAFIGGMQLKFGRIYGITISDASSYINRALFYNVLFNNIYKKSEFTGLSIASTFYSSWNDIARKIKLYTNKAGYNSMCLTEPYYRSNPVAQNSLVAWVDNRYGDSNIFIYDFDNQKEIQITNHPINQYDYRLFGNIIVWRDGRNCKPNRLGIYCDYDAIYMYNLVTKQEKLITDATEVILDFALNNDKIAWITSHNVYLYDITKNAKIIVDSFPQDAFLQYVEIFENKIIYATLKDPPYHSEVYLYNLVTNQKNYLFSTSAPILSLKIYGDKIMWKDKSTRRTEIYMYDLRKNKKEQITATSTQKTDIGLYNHLIGWSDNMLGSFNVYLFNLTINEGTWVTREKYDQWFSYIFDNQITWLDNRGSVADIRLYDLKKNVEKQIPKKKDPLSCSIHGYVDSQTSELFKHKQFITFMDHGSSNAWQLGNNLFPSSEIPYLDLTYGFATACLTNNFWQGESSTFSLNFLRKGGIGYHGTIGLSGIESGGEIYQPTYRTRIRPNPEFRAIQLLTSDEELSLGDIYERMGDYPISGVREHYLLLGDPSLKPIFKEVKWE